MAWEDKLNVPNIKLSVKISDNLPVIFCHTFPPVN